MDVIGEYVGFFAAVITLWAAMLSLKKVSWTESIDSESVGICVEPKGCVAFGADSVGRSRTIKDNYSHSRRAIYFKPPIKQVIFLKGTSADERMMGEM
jgi:hypothetical protein